FAASEMTPIAKVVGLGDVIGSLPKALRKAGVDARVIIPRYEKIKNGKNLKIEFLENISVKTGEGKERVSLYKTNVNGVEVFLAENEKYLSKGGIYFSSTAFASHFAEVKRFLFFSAAVREILRSGSFPFKPDIVHANDWHMGALVSFLKAEKLPLKTVFTVHNLGNQGKWNAADIDNFLVEKNIFCRFGKEFNFMAEGILNANVITTVSSRYAGEILTKQYGENLENVLRARKKDISGILNGVEYDFFNPAKDKFLFKKYSRNNLAAKEANKILFQKKYGLKQGAEIPLFGLVSRLTGQKGIHLISAVCGRFIKEYSCQFAFLGKGNPIYENGLAE
ncbi:MAG: glycogen/starch synthase, partial [Patescibacteria group bacterium]